jgi:hypothetical protein
MPNTPRAVIPYPLATDPPDGPSQMGALALQAEKHMIPHFTTAAARDAAITTPAVGEMCCITSDGTAANNGWFQYYGATTLWRPPWNLPWGSVGAVTFSASNQGSITALADVTSVSVAFTALVNRRYRVSALAFLSTTVAADQYQMLVTNAANTILIGGEDRKDMPTAGRFYQATIPAAFDTPAAGSVTYKMRVARANGTGTLTVNSTSVPTVLLVEDAGPVGTPPAS